MVPATRLGAIRDAHIVRSDIGASRVFDGPMRCQPIIYNIYNLLYMHHIYAANIYIYAYAIIHPYSKTSKDILLKFWYICIFCKFMSRASVGRSHFVETSVCTVIF